MKVRTTFALFGPIALGTFLFVSCGDQYDQDTITEDTAAQVEQPADTSAPTPVPTDPEPVPTEATGSLITDGTLIPAGTTVSTLPAAQVDAEVDEFMASPEGAALTADLAWAMLSPTEQALVCDGFWQLPDADIIDYFTSVEGGSFTLTESQAMVDLMWEAC